MLVHFSKYHGTGNDFLMIDGRQNDSVWMAGKTIARLCHRRFGIGADGLIVLGLKAGFDFHMRYFNADGGEGTMCGNGGRALVAFARDLGIPGPSYRFSGIDGTHEASLEADGEIRLKLKDVNSIEKLEDGFLLDTGSPHFVRSVEGLDQLDMELEGKALRHEKRFAPGGVNVNFVESTEGALKVRTFERGVEAETWSCGTGVTAAAIAAGLELGNGRHSSGIETRGGKLQVSYLKEKGNFLEIWLKGPALHVYDGTIEL